MNCESVRGQLAMLLYGELSFDEEGLVEEHLENCAECRAALEREQELHAAFDRAAVEPPSSLLNECRAELQERLDLEPVPSHGLPASPHGWWDRLVDALTFAPSAGWLRPAAAMALLAAGFLGARLAPTGFGFTGASMIDPGTSRVRSIEPGADGRVQIVFDETHQRVVSGKPDEQNIRVLLLAATKDPSEGVRAETVDVLKSHAGAADVRDMLVYSLRNDDNVSVRMRAMDGLKPFAQEPEVRKALSEVLLRDANPGMRKQAIEVLTQGIDGPSAPGLDRDIVGTLQELMNRESNEYVRERSQKALQLVNASAETY